MENIPIRGLDWFGLVGLYCIVLLKKTSKDAGLSEHLVTRFVCDEIK
ncbi:hypothetical protein ACFSTH_18585 [Paenibacillus yanchengensis]|uniref:Uncharacterized protein n=1 Tax=Paenibacillus yanchengensis TaxID=2035833 RepID=A0ABW4YLZ0_9BACL